MTRNEVFINFLTKNKYLFLLALVFFTSVALSQPFGNFSLNDDWLYSGALRDLLSGDFTFYEIITPTLSGQLIYSYLIFQIVPFSLTAIRMTTLVLSFFGVILFFSLLRNIGMSQRMSFFFALLLFFNPLYYLLSFTYMTDIPALSFLIFGLYFFERALAKKNYFFLSLSLLSFGFSVFIRQTSVIVFLIFILLYLVHKGKNIRSKDIVALGIPLILFLIMYISVLHINWWPSFSYTLHGIQTFSEISAHSFITLSHIFIYGTIFLLPLIVSYPFSKKQKIYAVITTIILLILYWYFFILQLLPIESWGNIINPYGLGPRHDVLSGMPIKIVPDFFWGTLFIIGIFGFPFLLQMLFDSLRREKFQSELFFQNFSLFSLLFSIGVVAIVLNFDRYILLPLLFVFIAYAFIFRDILINPGLLGILLLFCMAWYSIFGTSDYLSENRLRWNMASMLQANGFDSHQIDAGYEWLGWHHYTQSHKLRPIIDLHNPWYIRRLFPDNTRKFVISYDAEMEGYDLIEKHSYFAKLTLKQTYLYLHKKREL